MQIQGKSRENLLKAATRLFHLQGYHATGLNQILKESGAPKGSLYYHFPNGKEQLAVEAVNAMGAFVYNDAKHNLAQHDDAVEAFQFLVRNIARHFDDIDNLNGVPIGLLAAETSLISEPLRQACQAAFASWETLYREKLHAYGFGEDESGKLALVINAMIEGAITRSLTYKNGEPLYYVADCIPKLLRKAP